MRLLLQSNLTLRENKHFFITNAPLLQKMHIFIYQNQGMQSRDSCVQREISSSITLLHTGTIKVQMKS